MLASLLADTTITDGGVLTWLVVVAVVIFILCALVWLIRALGR